MDNKRPAAERVRPILQAMERSIDAARQRRLHTNDSPARDSAPQTSEHDVPMGNTDEPSPTRLKARPKRAVHLPGYESDTSYHSRAS